MVPEGDSCIPYSSSLAARLYSLGYMEGYTNLSPSSVSLRLSYDGPEILAAPMILVTGDSGLAVSRDLLSDGPPWRESDILFKS